MSEIAADKTGKGIPFDISTTTSTPKPPSSHKEHIKKQDSSDLELDATLDIRKRPRNAIDRSILLTIFHFRARISQSAAVRT